MLEEGPGQDKKEKLEASTGDRPGSSTLTDYRMADSWEGVGDDVETGPFSFERDHLVLRFKHRQGAYEGLVAKVTGGDAVHVEAVVHEPGTISGNFAYSAYMGEAYNINMIPLASACSDIWTSIAIPISPDEASGLRAFFMRLVEREVPYNYKDILLAAWGPGHGGSPFNKAQSAKSLASDGLGFMTTMFPDVDDDPESLESVYCSQAVVIGLRKCLKEPNHRELVERLNRQNSRRTSPAELYRILEPYSLRISGSSILAGRLRLDEGPHGEERESWNPPLKNPYSV